MEYSEVIKNVKAYLSLVAITGITPYTLNAFTISSVLTLVFTDKTKEQLLHDIIGITDDIHQTEGPKGASSVPRGML